jgi:Mg2+-importing ATPase
MKIKEEIKKIFAEKSINLVADKKTNLMDIAAMSEKEAIRHFGSSSQGLTNFIARRRLSKYGKNEVGGKKQKSSLARFLANFKDPLVILLLCLGLISFIVNDHKTAILITIMLFFSVILRFAQELKTDTAVKKITSLVQTTATVVRGGRTHEISLRNLVPGDIIKLSAGDIVPADVRLLTATSLFVNQAALTGEAMPAEKACIISKPATGPLDLCDICFMGTNVENGTATALVVNTGRFTFFGGLAQEVAEASEFSAFDKGIKKITWMILRFILVMAPLVFLINGIAHGNWMEAFLFAIAVSIGLTPELLPMIITVNLSKGAVVMSRKKVIVKRLSAIQNFGAMDVLCADKTGTLTEGRVVLIKNIDINGKENAEVLKYAYLNSFYQSGLKNMLDAAVLKRGAETLGVKMKNFDKVGEVPFDFVRRRMSVIVDSPKKRLLICKGSTEEILALTTRVMIDGKEIRRDSLHQKKRRQLTEALGGEGFRLIAVAAKAIDKKSHYSIDDEKDLTLLGFLAFFDPPKLSAKAALAELSQHGIAIKILTGDNEIVAGKICGEVGLPVKKIILGKEVEKMSDEQLKKAVETAAVFSRMEPSHKVRVIRALQAVGHTVGFLGDGINDAPALKTADIGISVDNAADIAKESSDIILLEQSLTVLQDGVREGRKIFANIIKYIRMSASSNFGNMFSVVGGSIFLPFLPMLPLQIIVNNLLYDISQSAIPTDNVDNEYLLKPRQWKIKNIEKFIFIIGPISSLFDFLFFGAMLYLFNAWANPELFRTGWFVESLLSETLVVHIIRTNKIPFLQSRASLVLTVMTLATCAFGAWLPFSPIADALGFIRLPIGYWAFLFAVLMIYFVLVAFVKQRFVQKYRDD